MDVYFSTNQEETEQIAYQIAKKLKKGSVIAMFGGLGMGKTCFVRGLAKGLDIDCDVSSPTFAIVNEYRGTDNSLFHFDMYRVDSWDSLYSTGFFDFLDENEFMAIEWSENIENALPENSIIVTFERDGENTRKITVKTGE